MSDRPPAGIRWESTTANGHWTVTEDGRCPVGPRKDHRPDLPQVKVMISALEPLGLPVATDVVPGQRAADPVYVPASTRVREGVGQRGLLEVGDGQMAARETRAVRHSGGDDDWWPLSERQLAPMIVADSRAPVWAGEQALTLRHRARPGGTAKLIAAGLERLESVTAEVAGQPHWWRERRVVVRSCAVAQAGERGLRARLAQAQAAVIALNPRGRGQRRYADPSARRQAVEASLARDRVQGLWHVRDQEQRWEQPLRRSGGRDAPGRLAWDVQVPASLDEAAVATAVRQLGWRVYVTTQPPAQLSRQEAVLAYRHESLVERAMGRLKGRPWSLTPMELERADQATGVIRLWSMGVRGLPRLEVGVRRRLARAQTTLAGLSVGNPTRATAHPTAERLLEAVPGLTLTMLREGRRRRSHLTPLSRGQRRMLTRLEFPVDISMRRCPDAYQPPSK